MKKHLFFLIMMSGSILYGQELPTLDHIASKQEEIEVTVTSNKQIDLLTDITYAQIVSQRSVRGLKMSILVPRDNNLKPAIIYFPGGGFTSADYNKFYEMKHALAEAGFVVAAAEYRTVPDRFPALVNDGKSAVRYIRAHAKELGVDPNRIGVLGDSAGGYVVQMLGTTNGEHTFDKGDFLDQSSDVQSVVTIYGISNLLNIGEGFGEMSQAVHASPSVTEALLVHGPAFGNSAGKGIGSDPEKALYASPVGHVKEDLPPFLIMHGSGDKLVSPDQSQQIFDALVAKGNTAQYDVVKDADHGGIIWYQQPIIQKVVEWFIDTLGKPTPNSEKRSSRNNNL